MVIAKELKTQRTLIKILNVLWALHFFVSYNKRQRLWDSSLIKSKSLKNISFFYYSFKILEYTP